ncbi:MAG: hypothetical protein ACF8OB_01660 [Phycisphaeraceae bacterium JB051]
MPHYEYFCPSNQQSVPAHHCSHRQVATWGQLCELTQTPIGNTPPDAAVNIAKQTDCHCHEGDCCDGHDHDHHDHDHDHDHDNCGCHSQPVNLSVIN